MHTITPPATGENKTFINRVLDVPSEKYVIAMSPITRPKVPASVAKRPKNKKEEREKVREVEAGKKREKDNRDQRERKK
jgi:hypothetical protein